MSWLYYPSSAIAQTSISDGDIHWTASKVINGEDKIFNEEYPNPVDSNTVFSNVGGGVQEFSCFYRMSPVTLLGSVRLTLKGNSDNYKFYHDLQVLSYVYSKSKLLILLFIDTAKITVNYEGFNMTFSDVDNPMFPSAQEVPILTGTTNIVLTCSLPECVWVTSDGSDVIINASYTIPEISESYSKNFSLLRVTSNAVSYTTAYVHIQAQVVIQLPSNSVLVAVIIFVLVLMIILATIAFLAPLCVYFCKKREKCNEKIQRPKPSIFSKNKFPGYENFSDLHSPSKDYIDLPANSNPQYMTIDETSMIPLESENKQKPTEYANLANKPTHRNTYEEINEGNMNSNIELDQTVYYERYVPMSSVIEEKKFVSRSIPTDEFSATYQQYVDSVIDNNSLFTVDFKNLNGDTKVNVELETSEALKIKNKTKNPFGSIIPFDENRLILDSPYFDCDYINASWLESYQFIASIHPTNETYRDFLQMIYQTEASMVVMLTTRKEKAKIISGISNRVCYWPKKEEPIECEPFLTTLINSTETGAFIKQGISLKNTSESKEHRFIQCISPIWNEDSSVADMTPASALLSRILKQIQEYPSKPIIIHCEDGISKTGILLSGINSVKELTHKKSINIFNSVKNLRRQRMKMVPTLVSV